MWNNKNEHYVERSIKKGNIRIAYVKTDLSRFAILNTFFCQIDNIMLKYEKWAKMLVKKERKSMKRKKIIEAHKS